MQANSEVIEAAPVYISEDIIPFLPYVEKAIPLIAYSIDAKT
jgi:hypothetical protein